MFFVIKAIAIVSLAGGLGLTLVTSSSADPPGAKNEKCPKAYNTAYGKVSGNEKGNNGYGNGGGDGSNACKQDITR